MPLLNFSNLIAVLWLCKTILRKYTWIYYRVRHQIWSLLSHGSELIIFVCVYTYIHTQKERAALSKNSKILKFVKWVEREFSLCNFKCEIISNGKVFFKNRANLSTIHTYTCISWGKGFLGEEFRIQTAWTLEEKCEDEPWKHLLINILGSSHFTMTDSRISGSIKVIPLKKFQMPAKPRESRV